MTGLDENVVVITAFRTIGRSLGMMPTGSLSPGMSTSGGVSRTVNPSDVVLCHRISDAFSKRGLYA